MHMNIYNTIRRVGRAAACIIIALATAIPAGAAQKHTKTRVACIGNSITYGLTLADPSTESYPAQLQRMLPEGYEVGNFGKSGTTLLRHGHRPYVAQEEWSMAKAFRPDIAVIHLGINDTDPRNWPYYRDEFVTDYLAIIDTLRAINPQCRIILAKLTPITPRHPRFESGTRQWREEISDAVATVASIAKTELVDFYRPLHAYPQLLPDAVHPNREGATMLARTVYQEITRDYGGLRMPTTYSDNMVLQRREPIRIHGTANAGSRVRVELAGHTAESTALADGTWSAVLPAMEAARSLKLTVTCGKKKIEYSNVAVGEVWLCSGQSNMEFTLKEAATAARDIPTADNPDLRLFDMKARWQTYAVEWDSTALDSINHLLYYRPAKWQMCTPATARDFSAVAYYFGRMLQDSLRVPVGLICNAVGGSPTESWVSRESLEHNFPKILDNWTSNDFIQPWVRQRATQNIAKAASASAQRHPYEPCYLYEAGVEPLEQYNAKGVIWYQGESNAHNTDAHERLFRLLVSSWRDNWHKADMPFYFVQLSSMDRKGWQWFRDSQRRLAAEIPGVGMAVSSDVGDSLNVHPTRKQPVGERLARLALHGTYGYASLAASGPSAVKAVAEDDGTMRVTFDNAEGMRPASGNTLTSFEIAQWDGLYVPAEARIEGNTVVLRANGVEHPRYVRYGWQPYSTGNLVGADGLPASTFRIEAE